MGPILKKTTIGDTKITYCVIKQTILDCSKFLWENLVIIVLIVIQVYTSLSMLYEKNYNFFCSRSRNKLKTVLNSAKQALLEFYTVILNLAGH